MEKIIYAATPFRMQNLTLSICDFIEGQGHFPIHPLLALPLERYNYDTHQRENIYRVCFGLVDMSDEVWIFGIGGGALKEYLRAREQGKEVRSYVKLFDPHWEEWSQKEKYHTKYKDAVEEVLRLSL